MKQALAAAVASLALLGGPTCAEAAAPENVVLVTFDGSVPGTLHDFKTLNDPVMGGQSAATFENKNGVGVFDGTVKIVPKLKAPGFVEVWADDSGKTRFADASSVGEDGGLVLTVRTTTPEYAGYKISFAAGALSPGFSCAAGGSIIGSRGCFKADFHVPRTSGSDFVEVFVPFRNFTDRWSSYTGEPTKTCQQDSSACISAAKLAKIQAVGIWGEGVAGDLHLEVKEISARSPSRASYEAGPVELAGSPKPPPSDFNRCQGPIQENLRYNMSSFTQPDVPVPVDSYETLATAVCCDKRVKGYAEPRFLFQSPYVDLYGAMMKHQGPTTFYDPVCGIPLFRAPVNRTMSDFEADTNEHGWPSFRSGELFQKNIITDKEGFVSSACGTHLGTYIPDARGPRYCIDLSCVAGNPK